MRCSPSGRPRLRATTRRVTAKATLACGHLTWPPASGEDAAPFDFAQGRLRLCRFAGDGSVGQYWNQHACVPIERHTDMLIPSHSD